MHGQFVWYELTTPDVDAARKFYPPITGWGTQQFDQNYTMWTSEGVPIGGIFRLGPEQQQQGIPPNWMLYVESDNVDETARLAASLGGTVVHAPTDIPGTGRFAVVQDPQGAVFGVYRSSGPSQGWDGTPTLGRVSWHELMTTDSAKAFDFYRRLFGWEKMTEMDMGGGNMYTMFGKGKMFGGMFSLTPDMAGMHPFWLCYVHVKDVNAAVAAAKKNRGTLHRGPMDIPGGVVAILGDPQGAGFAVHHATAAVAASRPARKKVSGKAARAKAKALKATAKAKTKAATKQKTGARKTAAPRKKAAAKKKPAAKKATRKRAAKTARRRR